MVSLYLDLALSTGIAARIFPALPVSSLLSLLCRQVSIDWQDRRIGIRSRMMADFVIPRKSGAVGLLMGDWWWIILLVVGRVSGSSIWQLVGRVLTTGDPTGRMACWVKMRHTRPWAHGASDGCTRRRRRSIVRMHERSWTLRLTRYRLIHGCVSQEKPLKQNAPAHAACWPMNAIGWMVSNQ